MKKGLIFVAGFIVIFLFLQTFVLAESNSTINIKIEDTFRLNHSVKVLFKVVSEVNISSCSVFLSSSKNLLQETSNNISNSKVNILRINRLSVNSAYFGNVVCLSSDGREEKSPAFFVLPSLSMNSSSNGTRISSSNGTRISSSNGTRNIGSGSVRRTNEVNSIKNFILGVSVGLGLLLISVGVGYVLWKKRRS